MNYLDQNGHVNNGSCGLPEIGWKLLVLENIACLEKELLSFFNPQLNDLVFGLNTFFLVDS